MTRIQRAIMPMFSFAAIRAFCCLAVVALLAACAGQAPQIDQSQEAAQYAAHARGNYTPPGTPEDPWGPYIEQASARFDVPDVWIRAVMNVESRGQEYTNGQLTTSPVGAMGLMQVMPQTYDDMREQLHLGDDAYDPKENILAGTAYLREMYDMYGSPGFLAAYNAGPRRLDDYLSNERPLPDETRRYVAMIAPVIEGVWPVNRSPAQDYAMNQLPEDIPPGLRYGGRIQLASSRHSARHLPGHGRTRVARLPEPPQRVVRSDDRIELASNTAPQRRHHGGFHLIARAYAEPAPSREDGSDGWAIQVGAFGREAQAQTAIGHAKAASHGQLGRAHPTVASVHETHTVLWRARLTGLSREAALKACATLAHSHKPCMVLSPEAQS
jgi:hypothetical protein